MNHQLTLRGYIKTAHMDATEGTMLVKVFQVGPDAHGQPRLCLRMTPGHEPGADRQPRSPDYVAWLTVAEAQSLLELIQAQLAAGKEFANAGIPRGGGWPDCPPPGRAPGNPGTPTRDDNSDHQAKRLGVIMGGAICAPTFRPNRKYCTGATADLIPYISYSDVMARQLIIRGRPSDLPLSNFCNEKHEILAQYPDIDALVRDGWVLD